MSRLLIAVLVALGLGFAASAPAGAQDINCADIATNEDAQLILAADPSDPYGLDRDNDGTACDSGVGGGQVTYESLFGAPPAATEPPAEEPAATEAPAEEPVEEVEVPAEAPDAGVGGTTTAATVPSTGVGVMTASSSMGLVALFAALSLLSAGVALRARRA